MKPFLKPEVLYLLTASIAIRLSFFFFGAELYYGSSTFYIGGDTQSFLLPIKNLIEHGTYSGNLNHPNAVFGRLPGYSFFLAPFYMLFQESLGFYMAICITQIIMDSFSTCLIYTLVSVQFTNRKLALLTAGLYACYPFSIVWTPIVYAETAGLFLLLLTTYITFKNDFKYPLLTGMLIAVGFFVRPQLLFLLPAFGAAAVVMHRKKAVQPLFLLFLGFLLVYSPWPIRNYVNHDKVVLMRDITSMRNWQNDVLYFHKYINSLQAGWEPQMTQLISNAPLVFPESAYLSSVDSLQLEKAVRLSRTCSDGFASFMGKAKVKNDCTDETAALWKNLLDRQIEERPLNYFLKVPLLGLKKGIFKLYLVSNWKSVERPLLQTLLISSLFLYRTLLLLMGFVGLFLLLKRRLSMGLNTMILTYFLSWYGWLCFVTRYLEIRYLLPADVLLLLPAAYLLHELLRRWTFGARD
jgi:hypothetical protein